LIDKTSERVEELKECHILTISHSHNLTFSQSHILTFLTLHFREITGLL